MSPSKAKLYTPLDGASRRVATSGISPDGPTDPGRRTALRSHTCTSDPKLNVACPPLTSSVSLRASAHTLTCGWIRVDGEELGLLVRLWCTCSTGQLQLGQLVQWGQLSAVRDH